MLLPSATFPTTIPMSPMAWITNCSTTKTKLGPGLRKVHRDIELLPGDEIDDEWAENRSSADVEELFDDETFEEYIPYFRKIYSMPTGWLWQVK